MDDVTDPGAQGATFEEFALAIARYTQAGINTAMPARVVKFHPAKGQPPDRTPAMVDVQPEFKYRYAIPQGVDVNPGEIAIRKSSGWQAQGDLPQITSVPVAYAGHAGMLSTGPLEAGEIGTLIFIQRSIDQWINTGGPVDPAFDYQWHHMSDPVFIPGLRYGTIAKDTPTTLHRIGAEDGSAGLEIAIGDKSITVRTDGPTATLDAATEVKLGAGATLGVSRLGDTVAPDTSMAAWIAAVNSALAGGVPVVVPPPTDFGVISSASTKVKAE